MTPNSAIQIGNDTLVLDKELTAEKFIRQLDAIHELPTLSTVAMQLSRMLLDINTSADVISRTSSVQVPAAA